MVGVFYLGVLLQLIGAIWLVIIAVQTGQSTGEKAIWGLVNFFCQPIGGIIFYFVKKVGLVPLLLVIVGVIMAGIGYSSVLNMAQTIR